MGSAGSSGGSSRAGFGSSCGAYDGRCLGGSGSTARSSGSGSSSRLGRGGSVGARAADTGNSNIVGINLESEVLKGIAVPRGPSSVILGQADDAGVLALAVVLYDTLTNLGNVEQTMEKVRSPVEVGGTVRNVVAEHAHTLEGAAELVRQVADDGL